MSAHAITFLILYYQKYIGRYYRKTDISHALVWAAVLNVDDINIVTIIGRFSGGFYYFSELLRDIMVLSIENSVPI